MAEPFRVVLADPAWPFDQPLKMADGVKRSSASQYRTQTYWEICSLGKRGGYLAE